MPTEKFIEVTYEYLKQGKWKQKTIYIKEENLYRYKNFRVISQKEVWR